MHVLRDVKSKHYTIEDDIQRFTNKEISGRRQSGITIKDMTIKISNNLSITHLNNLANLHTTQASYQVKVNFLFKSFIFMKRLLLL